MKIVVISDTHGEHKKLTLPPGDMLIHAGDVSGRGMKSQIEDFFDWFIVQPYKYKILVAGNHDFFFDEASKEEIDALIPSSVCYLNDSFVVIEGIKIWGSPITTWYYDWAFTRHRGAAIRVNWDLIPADSDIVVTHGPVHGILDKIADGKPVGCEDLLEKILQIKPKFHICGHIHDGYGIEEKNGITFINASILDANYVLKNKPIEFTFNTVNQVGKVVF